MKKFILVAFVLMTAMSCHSQEKKNSVNYGEQKVPDNAIPIIYHGHVYFTVNLDSVKGAFVFDTGADNLYLDSTFYAQNGFKHTKLAQAMLPGVGKTPQKVKLIMDNMVFSIHDKKFSSRMTPIIQLKPILGDISDGIIGENILNNFILRIDYKNEYAILYQTIDSIDLSQYKRIALAKRNNRYYLPLKIKINEFLWVTGTFMLDLGSGSSVNFTNEIAKKYNFDEKIKHKIPFYTKYGGLGGESSSVSFNSDSLWIGDFAFKNVKMEYSEDKSGALSGGNNNIGIIGNDILERFDVVIDFINSNLYLKPNSNFDKEFKFSQIGFSYVNRSRTKGVWVVTGLYKGSNAEKANLKIDDKIIRINDVDVNAIDIRNEDKILYQNELLELTIKEGSKIKKVEFKLETH